MHLPLGVNRLILRGFHALLDFLYLFAIWRLWNQLYPPPAKKQAISSTGVGAVNGAGSTFISCQRACWCSLPKEKYVPLLCCLRVNAPLYFGKCQFIYFNFSFSCCRLSGYPSSQPKPNTFTDGQRGLQGLCVRTLLDRSISYVRKRALFLWNTNCNWQLEDCIKDWNWLARRTFNLTLTTTRESILQATTKIEFEEWKAALFYWHPPDDDIPRIDTLKISTPPVVRISER